MSNPEEFGPGGPGGDLPPPPPPPPEEPEEEEPDEDPSDYIGPGMGEDDPPDPPPKPPPKKDDDDDEPPDPSEDFGPGSGGYIAPPPIPPIIPPDPIEEDGDTPVPDLVPDPVLTDTDDTVSSQTTEVLLQSAADQHQAKLEDLYEKKRSGKISAAEYATKKRKLESRHIRLVNYLQTGTGLKGHRKSAVDKWAAKADVLVKQAALDHIAAVKATLAGTATLTGIEIWKLRQEGKITAEQQAQLIAQLEQQHLANLLGVDKGVLEGKPFELFYTIPAETTTRGVLIERKDVEVAYGIGRGVSILDLQLTDVDRTEPAVQPHWDPYDAWRLYMVDKYVDPYLAHLKSLKQDDEVPDVFQFKGDTLRAYEGIFDMEQDQTTFRPVVGKQIDVAGAFIADTEREYEITAETKPPLSRSLADDPLTNLFEMEVMSLPIINPLDAPEHELPGAREEVGLDFKYTGPLQIPKAFDTTAAWEKPGSVPGVGDEALKPIFEFLTTKRLPAFEAPVLDTLNISEVPGLVQRPDVDVVHDAVQTFVEGLEWGEGHVPDISVKADTLRGYEAAVIEQQPPDRVIGVGTMDDFGIAATPTPVDDTEREYERRPGIIPEAEDVVAPLAEFLGTKRDARQIVRPEDTLRPEELGGVVRPDTDIVHEVWQSYVKPLKSEKRELEPLVVLDTLRGYEVPGTTVRPDVDIVDAWLRRPLETTVDDIPRLTPDTLRLYEVTAAQVPILSKDIADQAVTNLFIPGEVIDAIPLDPRHDTLIPSEVVSVEERPPTTAPPELFLEMIEEKFDYIGQTLRETGAGLRAEGRRQTWWYPQMVHEGLGLSVRLLGAAVEDFTMPMRPLFVAATIHNIVALAQDTELREEAVKEMLKDPAGTLVDIAGGVLGGIAFGTAFAKVSNYLYPNTVRARLERVRANVRTALRKTGERVILPGAEFIADVSVTKISKTIADLMGVERLPAQPMTTILGIENIGNLSILQKIDIPTYLIDDIMKSQMTWAQRMKLRLWGRTMKTAAVETLDEMPGQLFNTEIVALGQDFVLSVDDLEVLKTQFLSIDAKELGGAKVLDDITMRGFGESQQEAGRLGTLKLDLPERNISGLTEVIDDAGVKTLVFTKDPTKLTDDVFKYVAPREATAKMVITKTMDDIPVGVSKIDVFADVKLTQLDVDRMLSYTDRGPPVDIQSFWGLEGRKGILPAGLHDIDVKGWIGKLDEAVDPIDDFDVEFIGRRTGGPKTPYPVDIPEKVTVPKPVPSKPTSPLVILDDIAKKSGLDELAAGAPPVVKVVVLERKPPPIPPGLSAIGAKRTARMGPPSRFDAPDMPGIFPAYKHTTKGVMPNPFTFDPTKDKTEIERRTKDRTKKKVDVPKPKEDILSDIFKAKPKPKLTDDEEIIFKPKEDIKPIEKPDIVHDQTEIPVVVPADYVDEIIKPLEEQLPATIPQQIPMPIDIPITIEDVTTVQPPPGWTFQPPLQQLRRWQPEDDRDFLADWFRPSWGVKQLGRTVKIGTPRQALRGAMRIFGPPRPPTKKTKKKKKKDEEEEDFLSILFGGKN